MNECTKYLAPNYPPTNDDILNLRTVTQTVSDTLFTVEGKGVHFIDVSGLKHHRKTWLSYFDNASTVLFVVSLSSYDQTLTEDTTINRMVDAIVLFDQMANHQLLKKIDFILFLNKKDLYEKKVRKVSIAKYFPEYQGIRD